MHFWIEKGNQFITCKLQSTEINKILEAGKRGTILQSYVRQQQKQNVVFQTST